MDIRIDFKILIKFSSFLVVKVFNNTLTPLIFLFK